MQTTYISYTLYYSLCQLSQLEKLDIVLNPLKRLPKVVSSLTSLKELDMEGCKLSNLPKRFVWLNFCFVLNIQYLTSLYTYQVLL